MDFYAYVNGFESLVFLADPSEASKRHDAIRMPLTDGIRMRCLGDGQQRLAGIRRSRWTNRESCNAAGDIASPREGAKRAVEEAIRETWLR